MVYFPLICLILQYGGQFPPITLLDGKDAGGSFTPIKLLAEKRFIKNRKG